MSIWCVMAGWLISEAGANQAFRLQADPPQPVARRVRIEREDLAPVQGPDWVAVPRFVLSHHLSPRHESGRPHRPLHYTGPKGNAIPLPGRLSPLHASVPGTAWLTAYRALFTKSRLRAAQTRLCNLAELLKVLLTIADYLYIH